MHTLDSLNRASRNYFIQQLGGVFEHSSWVAECAASHRPFASRAHLHARMCACVREASAEQQLQLIRAHPELAGKAAIAGELTTHSKQEQRGAGLDQCSAEEFAAINELNAAYSNRFGFPFIIAVKGHSRESIIQAMRERMNHNDAVEFDTALTQIERIAGFRLEALISD